MRYFALLAIFATVLAAPAPERQAVLDIPPTYNEHEANTPHVEVNLYVNGDAPVSDTSTAFRCYYCGNQATNDLRTTAVCKTAAGKIKACGSKEDGLGCMHSKFTQAQFARECGIVGCISDAKTCSSSSSSNCKDHEEKSVSNPDIPSPTRRCYSCGSQILDDQRTAFVCGKANGNPQSCGSKGPMSCVNSKFDDDQFGKECGIVGCISSSKSCSSSSIFDDQEETTIFDEPQTKPIEVKVYVNEL